MKIRVEYSAQARHLVGIASEEVEVIPPCRIQELIVRLAETHGDPFRSFVIDSQGNVSSTVLISVNGEHVFREEMYELKKQDVVSILSPIAGG